MTDFITSDHHFYHKNVLEFEPRPFEDNEEMHAAMIDAWNAVVKKTDTVYYLGDFCFGNDKEWVEILNQLRGNIIFIKGNHDKSTNTKKMHRDGWIKEYHTLGIMMKREGLILNLSHYPMLIGARPRNFSIHGHVHSEETGYTNHINVGVDGSLAKQLGKPFGTPIAFDELIAFAKERNVLVEAERELLKLQRQVESTMGEVDMLLNKEAPHEEADDKPTTRIVQEVQGDAAQRGE